MSDVRPHKEIFEKLIEFDIVTIENDKYVYSPLFVKNVNQMVKQGVRRVKQVGIGKRAAKHMDTTILAYKSFRNRKNINNLLRSYACFEIHMKKTKQKIPRHHDQLVYGVWYLNDHEPEVSE